MLVILKFHERGLGGKYLKSLLKGEITTKKKKSLRKKIYGFPGVSVARNPPANAGDRSSIPDPGRFHMLWSSQAHVPQLLSLRSRDPRAATTEACLRTYSLCSATREATTMRRTHTAAKTSP